jgi:hypothetical protein
VGFEPTNGGFADLSLGPLGYRAELLIIAKIVGRVRAHRSCIFLLCSHYFFLEGSATSILASRRNRAASSGGVGLI